MSTRPQADNQVLSTNDVHEPLDAHLNRRSQRSPPIKLDSRTRPQIFRR